jgi:hypothetical protein
VAALLVAASSAAQPSSQEKAMASQLFDDAEKLMASGSTAQACPKYAESQRLDPQLGTLLHLGECYARAGKPASAWASFKDALEIAQSRNDPREPKIKQRVAELEKTLPKLVIQVAEPAPEGLEIKQDGDLVGKAIWGSPVPVDPGEHAVTAAAPGMKPWKGSVQVAAGAGIARIEIPPLEAEPAPATPPAAAAAPAAGTATVPVDEGAVPHDSSRGNLQRILGWSTAGLGLVGIGVGVAFELKRSSKLSERDGLCPDDMCDNPNDPARIASLTDQARTASTIGAVGFIAGGVLIAGGMVLVFTAPHGDAATSVSAFPVVARDFQGVAVTGRIW